MRGSASRLAASHRGLWLALVAAFAADEAAAQDKPPAAPAPTLRLVPAPGNPVGFKLSAESSCDASTADGRPDAPRLSTYEMTLAVEVLSADASGTLDVTLRIARITGRSTRLGMGSFDFDSEAAPPEDPRTRSSAFQFTALAGAEFRLRVAANGAVAKVAGVDAARKLVAGRTGDDSMLSMRIDTWISEDSVRGLFLSVLGPAPLPTGPLTPKTTWIDKDTLAFNSWEATYEVSRALQPSSITKDSVRLGGRGTVKLVTSSNVALMPLQMCRTLQTSEVSDWTISTADGLPISGSETITMEGSFSAGRTTLSSKHSATFRVTRLAAPPLPAERPLAGAKDAEALRAKESDKRRKFHEERRNERARDGTRGAWGVSDDGVFVAAGTPTGDVEVWRADGTRPVAVLKGHTDLIASVAFSDAGRTVFACSEDGTIRQWDVGSGAQTDLIGEPYQTELVGGTSIPVGYESLTTSADARYYVFIDGTVNVWDSKKDAYLDPPPDTSFARAAWFLRDSRRLVVASLDAVELYDLQAPPKREPDLLEAGKTWVHMEPKWRLVSDSHGFVDDAAHSLGTGYDIETAVFDGPNLAVTLTRPEGRDKGKRPVLRAWDLLTGKKRWEVATDVRHVVHAQKAAAVLVEDDSTLSFLSPKDGKLLRSLPLPTSPRVARVFSPDGTAWFDADKDGNLVRVPVDDATKPPPAVGPEKR